MTERRAGNSRLVYNKATRTIDTVHAPGPGGETYLTPDERDGQADAFDAFEMRGALLKLANECDALRAFEADIRAIVGNTNWNVLRLRVEEARAILKPNS
jgi:hypothetical protein